MEREKSASGARRQSLCRIAARAALLEVPVIVEREREIQNFVAKEYWTIDADLAKDGDTFTARYSGPAGKKKQEIADKETSDQIVGRLRSR